MGRGELFGVKVIANHVNAAYSTHENVKLGFVNCYILQKYKNKNNGVDLLAQDCLCPDAMSQDLYRQKFKKNWTFQSVVF